MLKKWLDAINFLLLLLCIVAASAYLKLQWLTEESSPRLSPLQPLIELSPSEPRRWFDRLLEKKENIPLLFELPKSHYSLTLPDLRGVIVFHGKNRRPDGGNDERLLFFSLTREGQMATTSPEKKLYLLYDEKSSSYLFSPLNGQTPFSFCARIVPGGVEIEPHLTLPDQSNLLQPEERRRFFLPEKELPQTSPVKWEIGKWRADATLFARQKAKWYGQDQFINRHGGEELKELIGRERIDFGEGEERYSLFVSKGDCLSWQGERWQKLPLGEKTRQAPLLCILSIEERLMKAELWDIQGRSRVTINLLKAIEPWNPKMITNDFKFLATRSLSQYVFEIKGERMILSPNDWLFLVGDHWEKITVAEQLEEYVERRLTTPLFIFEGPFLNEGKQFVRGLLYNATRSQVESIEIPLVNQGSIMKQSPSATPDIEEEGGEDRADEGLLERGSSYKG